jgi:hypothetical protein
MIQGYLKKQDSGRYTVCGQKELNCGAGLEVETAQGWVPMWIEHDGSDYYLVTKGLSFYPKTVYVRYC